MSIVIEDAVKKYGRGESEIYALNHVSLQIESGEVCVILGPSGSGKSTLLHMIGGLDQLDSGSVTVDGTKITELGKKELTEYRREKAGVVFQFYNLIAELNVKENIRVVADISKRSAGSGYADHRTGTFPPRHAFPGRVVRRTAAEMRHRQGARQKSGYFTV